MFKRRACVLFAATFLSGSLFAAEPARHSPAWLNSGVIYEIFPRSFSPEGSLNGITRRLDDLQAVGVNILWLMPIHPCGQVKKKGTLGSPYAVRDYYAIDPAYGSKDDFRRLVQEAHRRQMKVIIDVVANHTSWDSVMMAHPDFYKHDKDGHITYPYDWTDVAALNYGNQNLRRYMLDMLAYWIKEFDLDGYRCDAAAEVPKDFWEQSRTELEKIKPDIMMLAEASKPELLKKAFDIDYAWPLMATLNDVFLRGEPATAVRKTMEQQQALFPEGALHMRVSDDHDELRGVERYGLAGTLAVSAMLFTLDGVPVLYNGMEVGDTVESRDPALFEPFKIFWEMGRERPQFDKFYKAIIALRRQHAALSQGATLWLHNSAEDQVVTYARHLSDEEFLIAVNLSGKPFHGTVEASGAWTEMKLPMSAAPAAVEGVGIPALSLDAYQARIFQRQR